MRLHPACALSAIAGLAFAWVLTGCGSDGGEDRPVDAADAVDARERDTDPSTPDTDIAVLDTSPEADTATDTGADTRDTAPDTTGVPAEVIVETGADALPAAFAAAGPGTGAGPGMAYPNDGTLMPRNTAPPVIQWFGPDTGRYRLTVRTESREHHVYTTTWRWEPQAGVWGRLVAEASDGPMELRVAELDASGALLVGEPVTLRFSAANVEGAVYYWAPTANGIVRLPLGETTPELFLANSAAGCVGCHALSPDGTRLAYSRTINVPQMGTLGVIGTDEARTQYVDEGTHGLFYPSFGPDNVQLAATRSGRIVILNTDTGVITDELDRPEGTSANFAAWSPRGDAIVFAAGASTGGGLFDPLGASSAGLARVRRQSDGTWGAAEWLLENGAADGPPENLFYPAYSPNGRWIVFNRAHRDVAVGGSPEGAELWVISAEGTSPVRLDAASGPLGTTNSWPKWAPASADGTLWIAFTSTRPYGRIGAGIPQIWIAGLTPGRALPGFDPSWSAFWLPGQGSADSNHVAYWAEFEKD